MVNMQTSKSFLKWGGLPLRSPTQKGEYIKILGTKPAVVKTLAGEGW